MIAIPAGIIIFIAMLCMADNRVDKFKYDFGCFGLRLIVLEVVEYKEAVIVSIMDAVFV
ncbi:MULTISPECIES: hypothetical protein [unclassified Paenibacillus]|uniref:hypothetical protein n=1 Tax=unclassified Paenibacillus TaxID=185978 RepID=UPI001AE1F3A8|nr:MULTISPECIES: hypothetical protein [unclassified Paenibacillus]MBP1156744.1 hypothetical protein [Paenibacillus sp. PvP091]MBP1172517.1 hypothetical protein [Paenibacillus sp. PvR098]MBP2438898.1 hypothetical protein [Paenibacillus sp. PvP052]